MVCRWEAIAFVENRRRCSSPCQKHGAMVERCIVEGCEKESWWLCPSEVVKQQMQAGMYGSTGEAVRVYGVILWLRWLLSGIFGWGHTFRVAQLTCYEVTKNFYLRVKGRRMNRAASAGVTSGRRGKEDKAPASAENLELNSADAAICGAIAGSFSAATASPLDRIKTLLMTDSAAYGSSGG